MAANVLNLHAKNRPRPKKFSAIIAKKIPLIVSVSKNYLADAGRRHAAYDCWKAPELQSSYKIFFSDFVNTFVKKKESEKQRAVIELRKEYVPCASRRRRLPDVGSRIGR